MSLTLNRVNQFLKIVGEFASSNQICHDSNSSLSNSNDNVCNVRNDSGNIVNY